MKKLLFIFMLAFSLISVKAQNVESLNFHADCPSNTISSWVQMDSAYSCLVWVEWYDGSNWNVIFESMYNYTASQDTFTYVYHSTTPILNGDYRLGFVTADGLEIGDPFYFGLMTANCGNYASIPNNDQAIGEPVKTEYYNLSGQSIEPINSGMYVVVSTYSNGYQVRKKQFIVK
jgi:hypothetical protein